ncbi:hypothetical protein WN943_020355 [Citrus x changshan-huyou]
MIADIPSSLPSGKRSRCIHHHADRKTTINNKEKKRKTTSTGCSSDGVADRAALLKLRFSDIILKAQNYIHDDAHGVNQKLQGEEERRSDQDHEDENEAAAARRRSVQLDAQRKAARLQLENMEKHATFQVQDNLTTFKQLENLAGCLFSFVIVPKITEDGDASKVTSCAVKGRRFWNPLEKIGLTIKGDRELEGERLVKKMQEKPRHHSTRTRRLQLESQRQAARLELHKIESNVVIQDNFKSFKQLQDLAGCCLSFMIDPSLDDNDAAKVTMGAFRGTRFWNPLEKIGLHLKY